MIRHSLLALVLATMGSSVACSSHECTPPAFRYRERCAIQCRDDPSAYCDDMTGQVVGHFDASVHHDADASADTAVDVREVGPDVSMDSPVVPPDVPLEDTGVVMGSRNGSSWRFQGQLGPFNPAAQPMSASSEFFSYMGRDFMFVEVYSPAKDGCNLTSDDLKCMDVQEITVSMDDHLAPGTYQVKPSILPGVSIGIDQYYADCQSVIGASLLADAYTSTVTIEHIAEGVGDHTKLSIDAYLSHDGGPVDHLMGSIDAVRCQ